MSCSHKRKCKYYDKSRKSCVNNDTDFQYCGVCNYYDSLDMSIITRIRKHIDTLINK